MPIWLRRFTFNKMKEWFDKQNQEDDLNTATNNQKEIYQPGGARVAPPSSDYTAPKPKK